MLNLKSLYIACTFMAFSALHADSGRDQPVQKMETKENLRTPSTPETFKGSIQSMTSKKGITTQTFTNPNTKNVLAVSEDAKGNPNQVNLTSPQGVATATLKSPGVWAVAVSSAEGNSIKGNLVMDPSGRSTFTGRTPNRLSFVVSTDPQTKQLSVNGILQKETETATELDASFGKLKPDSKAVAVAFMLTTTEMLQMLPSQTATMLP